MFGRLNNKYAAFKKYASYDREPFFEIAKKYTIGREKLLDIGPGVGAFADSLGRDDICLVEGNPKSVAKLKARYQNVVHARMPERLPFDDSSFDFVHCSHIIEHLPHSDTYLMLHEIDRLLRGGGVLVISGPTLYDGFYNDFSHVKPYNPAVFIKYLVRGDDRAATRSMVSGNYEQLELVWRHTFTQMNVPVWGRKERPSLFNKLLYGTHLWLRKFGFGHYERSGFTLVLRKKSD